MARKGPSDAGGRGSRPSRRFSVQRGAMLGRYEILSHLADGGMAQVLLARTKGLEGFERHVVIKRIHAEQAHDTHYVSMLLDEARLAASLHHHNIVQVHDVGESDGEFFYAMEYVHGRDLRELLRHLSLTKALPPLEHVLTIATAVAAALHHAHEMRGPDRRPLGIVHRDVSPANILLGFDGNVKVADFGIAKAIARTSETESGAVKGKVAYMSPEQCKAHAVDRRSDVFSLGIVLWELATVRRLFKGESDFLKMQAIVAGDVPDPSSVRPELPAAFDAIVQRALAVSPHDRYQTAEQLRVELEDFATIAGVRTSTTALGDYMIAQFGEQQVPWLADGAGGEEVITEVVDLDDIEFEKHPSASDDRRVATIPDSSPAGALAAASADDESIHEVATVVRPTPADFLAATMTMPSPPPAGTDQAAVWPKASGSEIAALGATRGQRIAIAAAAFVVPLVVAFAIMMWRADDDSPSAPPPTAPPPPAATVPAPPPPVEPPAATTPPPAAAEPAVAEPAVAEPAVAPASEHAATTTPTRPAAPVKRAPPPRRIVKPVQRGAPAAHPHPAEQAKTPAPAPPPPAGKPNCDPPFYFEGTKKIFKPACV